MPDISLLSKITSISSDIFVIVAIATVLFFYGIYFGKDRITSLVLAFYPAILLFLNFPYRNKLIVAEAGVSAYFNTVLVFLIFLTPIHLIFNRIVRGDFSYNRTRRITHALILSLAATALVILLSYHIIPINNLYRFGTNITTAFGSKTYLFWWLLAPLVAIFITRR